MTTLRVEVGRCSGTTVEDVVEGLRRAGCMKDVEIISDAHAFLPIEELKSALEADRYWVDVHPDPPPPPLPWWRRVRGWPRRAYYWGRRIFLRETETEQFVSVLMEAYTPLDSIHAAGMRESPILKRLREQQGDEVETFMLRGAPGRAPGGDGHPICWACRAALPNGPGSYTAHCPECGARWDGSEAPPG